MMLVFAKIAEMNCRIILAEKNKYPEVLSANSIY